MAGKQKKDFCDLFRVASGKPLSLGSVDPRETRKVHDKEEGEALLAVEQQHLIALQRALYAEGRRAVLICLQGMDASGKDGAIRHVFSGLNPQGCRVQPFVQPTPEELSHDFLWRVHRWAPRHGNIVVFNRSHYEDVLVARVQKLVAQPVWRARYEHIRAFERLLVDSGTTILKFFLHISKEEQLERFEQRLADPLRRWKISEADYDVRQSWDAYREAYEEALAETSTDAAPWFVVPADRKWYRNIVVARVLRETLEEMDIRCPEPRVDLDDIRKRYHKAVAAAQRDPETTKG